MTEKLKIVYCTGSLYGMGGAERVLITKANLLAEQGHDVFIITADQRNKPFCFEISPLVQTFDVAVSKLFSGYIFPFISSWIAFPKILKWYQDFIDKIQPDIIIVNELGYDDKLVPKLKTTARKIREFHSSHYAVKKIIEQKKGIDKIRTKITNQKSFNSFKNFDCLVLLTERDKQMVDYPLRVEVIPNLLNIESHEQVHQKSKKVISVGRFDNLKNHKDLIMAWELTAVRHPDWTLHIFGDGPELNNLQNLIAEKKLEQHIFLEGKSSEIWEEYQKSSFMVFSSLAEGFGMVIIEAMQAGLPVISYDIPCGPNEIISDGKDGFLVPIHHINLLSERINFFIENPFELQKASHNSLEKSKEFLPNKIIPKWLNLFYSLKYGV